MDVKEIYLNLWNASKKFIEAKTTNGIINIDVKNNFSPKTDQNEKIEWAIAV